MTLLKTFFLLLFISAFVIISHAETLYVDAELGSDLNTGTINSPFKTINKAISKMSFGDICEIKGGIYRETILIDGLSGITIQSAQDEYVLITGLDTAVDCSESNEDLNWIEVAFQPSPIDFIPDYAKPYIEGELVGVQVFYQGQRQFPARYPNEDGNMFSTSEWAMTTTSLDKNRLEADGKGKVTFDEGLGDINNLEGAYYVGLNSGRGVEEDYSPYLAARGKIKEQVGNNVLFVEPGSNYWNNNKVPVIGDGKGYIIGSKSLINTGGEWYHSIEDNILYYQPYDKNTFDSTELEIRKRLYGLVITQSSENVIIKGLHFKAASFRINGESCTVENCTFRYISPFVGTIPVRQEGTVSNHELFFTEYGHRYNGTRGAFIDGKNNTIKSCYFGGSWRSLVNLHGSLNTIENCLLEDANWQAERSGAIFCTGDQNIITVIRGKTEFG